MDFCASNLYSFTECAPKTISSHSFMARLAQWRETEPEAAISAEDFQPVRQQESGRDLERLQQHEQD